MEMNLVVLKGTLATDPEIQIPPPTSKVKYLVTVRTGGDTGRRRVDVIPVVMYGSVVNVQQGDDVWVVGAVQRTFFTDGRDGTRSGIHVVAYEITRIEDIDGST